MKRLLLILVAATIVAGSVGCRSVRAGSGEVEPRDPAAPATLWIGYFPNLTHTQPLVGLARGTFSERLGPNVRLETRTFNAGPSAIEAIYAGQLDIAYIGPSPAINGYVRSQGRALRIIAGATSGGAAFVVRSDSGITRPADLAGRKVSSPQIGNTQDVALRTYLLAQGVPARENRGSVSVIPAASSDILNLFRRGQIDGAWVPEPWATRLVREANGRVFLDERALWPGGDFATTMVVVRTAYLQRNPDVVENFLRAHVETTQWINSHPDEAKRLVNEGIRDVSGASLAPETIDAAWANQKVTYDPVTASLRKSVDDAFRLGFLGAKLTDMGQLYALGPLNKVLVEMGLRTVND
jgi:NitT/TauT family transport system substrate-binding protein